ncbi:S41 family peptidase [Sphingobacterium spiritivorum]|uniref:S41 family peptidase n=1 Tax=Sphingobacterium spiritivorum TaxID=258 RepID=UPI0019192668|nr:S41 family peptidase [Sphingobacterium spiritivorum]QQT27921.1 S41 family peptidase [Sphingobacterium spiritivorum]
MNRYFLLVWFLLFSTFSFSQSFKNETIKSFIDKSIELIEVNSIHTENLENIKRELYNKSQSLNLIDEIAPLYEEVFKQLNDYHGGLKYKGKTYGWNNPNAMTNAYLKDKIKTNKNTFSKVFDKKIGYIRIIGNNDFAFKKVDSLTNDLVFHINNINSNKIKGWIIDLRLNTGGNMYPILLGLKEFIGDNIMFGGFRDAHNKSTGNWEIKEGKLLIDGIVLDRQTDLDYPIKTDIPVIILTSCYTASAGEMTAISFIGRNNVSIVGEPTANYTTAVQGFEINENAGINLSTDYVVDRNLKVYKSNILPDFEVLDGDNLEDLKNDLKIIKALELLRK